MSSPARKIAPDVGRRTPVRQLKKVLLPAPLGPMMARTSPLGTAKSTPLRAVSPPKRTVSFSVRSRGRARPGEALALPLPPGPARIGSTVTYEANLQAGRTTVLSFGITSLIAQ